MMYFLLGISLIFACLLIVNLLFTVFTSAFWGVISNRMARLTVNERGHILFVLSILPAAAALLFVSVFLVPGYLLHEPAQTREVVTIQMGIIAGAGLLGVMIALYRVAATWMATRRLTAEWLSGAVGIRLPGIDVPVHRIQHHFPVIAVIGIFRPKMFIAEQVLESLDENELAAATAHEYGHLRAYDNLRWTVLRVCRNLLILPLGKNIDKAWAENSEAVADAYAAKTGRSTALDLAAALVKIARIVPAHTSGAMPTGAFFIEEERVDVTTRVQRLVRLSEENGPGTGLRLFGLKPSYLWIAVLTALGLLPLLDRRVLVSTHGVIETFVHILQ